MDQLFRSLLRGFGWTLGRRAAYRVPLWPMVIIIVVLYMMGVRF